MSSRVTTILCLLGTSLAAAAPALADSSAAGGIGCHPEWPVVSHHADGQPAPLPAGAATPVACAVDTGYATSESTLAVTPDQTLVYSPAQTENSVTRSLDGGASWSLAYPADEQYTSLWNTVDPQVIADRRTGRVFWVHATGDLRTTSGVTSNSPLPNSIQTIVAYAHGFQVYSSRNDGRDWTTADYHNEQMGDWEKIFAGPPTSPASGAPQPTGGYAGVVYVCANSPFEVSGPGRLCYRSLDGGATFNQAGYVFPSASAPAEVCPSLASNTGVVGNDGSTYQPVSCSSNAYVAISHDEGATYSWQLVKDAPPENGLFGSLQLAIDQSDNLYGLWVMGDKLYLAVSTDHAKTWGKPINVAAPGVHSITRPAFAAGARGQVAITYYASHDPSAQTLTAYITQTLDALAPQPLLYSGALNDPAHPIYIDGGLTGGSPRADYVGGSYDSRGTFWAGVVRQLGPPDANKNIATTGYVGHLEFLGQTAGGATPAIPHAATCVPPGRLVFRINPVPHGRVVRALAYVNGRRVASLRGRSLSAVGFTRPAGPRLVVRIITVNNLGGRVVTIRTLRGCKHGPIRGTVHRHRKAKP